MSQDKFFGGPTLAGGDVEKPLLCLVRHLSPAGRFLSRSAFEFFMKTHPAAGEGRSDDDLLRIEIGKSTTDGVCE